MAETIATRFENGITEVVKTITTWFLAKEVYHLLGGKHSQEAIYFMEQWRYFKITGNLMQ